MAQRPVRAAGNYSAPPCWRSSGRVKVLWLHSVLVLLLLLSYTKAVEEEEEERNISEDDEQENVSLPLRSFQKKEKRQVSLGRRRRSIKCTLQAGSGDPATPDALRGQILQHLTKAEKKVSNVKGLVCPHDSYVHSGETAAWGYKQLEGEAENIQGERILDDYLLCFPGSVWKLRRYQKCPIGQFLASINTVFILAPLDAGEEIGCFLPEASAEYETVLGSIKLDIPILQALHKTDMFHSLSPTHLMREQSVAMQLPFLQVVLQGKEVTLVPIYCSCILPSMVQNHAAQLLRYFVRPGNLFIISNNLHARRNKIKGGNAASAAVAAAAGTDRREVVKCFEQQDYLCLEDFLVKRGDQLCGYQVFRIYLRMLSMLRNDEERAAAPASRGPASAAGPLSYADKEITKRVTTQLLNYSQATINLNQKHSGEQLRSYVAFATIEA